MFENEMKEILDLVLEISTKTDASVSYNYDSESKTLSVLAEGKLFTVSNGKFLVDKTDECKRYLVKLGGVSFRRRQLRALKHLHSSEIAECINELLQELQKRDDPILDYENPEMALNRIEYHAAGGWLPGGRTTPVVGDGSDNLYCFFEEVQG